jgi:hypothetical protein
MVNMFAASEPSLNRWPGLREASGTTTLGAFHAMGEKFHKGIPIAGWFLLWKIPLKWWI